MTQADLANAIGISRAFMSHIENGLHTPSLNVCKSICYVLNKSLDDLFYEPVISNQLQEIEPKWYVFNTETIPASEVFDELSEKLKENEISEVFEEIKLDETEKNKLHIKMRMSYHSWEFLKNINGIVKMGKVLRPGKYKRV